MKKMTAMMALCLLASPVLAATGLNLTIERSALPCEPNAFPKTVHFDIYGELTGDASEGLAAIGFDLSATFEGAPFDVTAATVTAGPGMTSFERNQGITNPAGYGGTDTGEGKLVQIGGAQDTINNGGMVAPFPTGPVVTDVGNGGPVLLASVEITLTTAPSAGEDYIFTVDSVFGNVIDAGETGPVYSVTALDAVASATYEIHPPCVGDVDESGVVNAADRGFVSANIGCDVSNPALCECKRADVDGSGVVNASDRGFVSANIGPCP